MLGLAAAGIYFATKPAAAAPVAGIGSINYPNYHILKVSYVGPTNYKSDKVKIVSERFKQTIFISYNTD
jgi:hypothetical protein